MRWAQHFRGANRFGAFRRSPVYGGFVAYPSDTVGCNPTQEIMTVPAEAGGTAVQITINRCN